MAKKKTGSNKAAEGFFRTTVDFPEDLRRRVRRVLVEEGRGYFNSKIIAYTEAGVAIDEKRLGIK